MIIGVEGNVHVGKTTFIITEFKNKDFIIVKETPFKKENTSFNTQIYYINSEINKKNSYNSQNIILDRTLISTYIYSIYSNKFSRSEIRILQDLMNDYITYNNVFIPDIIYFVMYPFDLICQNHSNLYKEKGTQNNLIDYEYYLKFSLFFSNNMSYIKEIKYTNDFRQIIEFSGKNLFKSLNIPIKIFSKILLDGATSIGKTTIGRKQKNYNYIPEFKYKPYSLENYTNQMDSIIERMLILKKNNILADTSFLMGITHLFYFNKTSKEFKLDIINQLIEKVPLCLYITKIIYLVTTIDILNQRKNNDNTRNRNHFNDNNKYLNQEINFYKILNKNLNSKSNIYIIDAYKDTDQIINEINLMDEKPLLLIDLLYCIKESIEGNEL